MVGSGDSQNQNKKFTSDLMEFYHTSGIITSMSANFNAECQKIGYGLFCSPCPMHKEDKYDMIIFDKYAPKRGFYWTCAKEPKQYTDSFPGLTSEETEEMAKISVTKGEIQRTRSEIIARYLLTHNIFISIRNSENFAIFAYRADKGCYQPEGKEVLKVKIQEVFSQFYSDEMVTKNLVDFVLNQVIALSERGSEMKIFDNDDGVTYFIPFLDRDIQVNRGTGKMEVKEKDPINRPFLSALPYSLSDAQDTEMPPEIKDLLELVSPTHRDELLMEMASPLVFQGTRRIYVNFSRVGSTGKSTLLRRIQDLYPDLTAWVEPDTLGQRFEKGAFLGKSSVLMDEYEGGGITIRRQLKTLASGNTLRAEIKNGPILNIKNRLSVIVNTNNLQFDWRDDALLDRLIIIPFVKNFQERKEPEPWSEENKRRIVWYLVRNVLPKYFLTDLKKYPIQSLKKWCQDSMSDEQPEDGLEDFLLSHVHRGLEKSGLLLTPEEAYRYYLMWAGWKQLIPLTQKEYLEKLNVLAKRDNSWVFDGKMSLITRGLEFFMR